MPAPRKKLKTRLVKDVPALPDASTMDKLSEYELEHIFKWLSFSDKGRAAQVCRRWKSTIYQVALWRNDEALIKETAEMEIMAPSLVKRGITEVCISGGKKAKKGKCNTPSKFLDQQLCHVTKIMAASLTCLDFCVERPVGFIVLQRVISMPMPNLKSLCLGKTFEVRNETLTNICDNCRNLSKLVISDCKNIDDKGMILFRHLRKLESLTMEHSQHVTDMDIAWLSFFASELIELCISYSGITDMGVAYFTKLRNLRSLDLTGCHRITSNCINILSNANSAVRDLKVTLCADIAMEKIGRSTLSISSLTVGRNNCCAASDSGINGLLNGRKPIRRLEILGRSVISVNGMTKLVNQLKDLEWLWINAENKIDYARREAELARNN